MITAMITAISILTGAALSFFLVAAILEDKIKRRIRKRIHALRENYVINMEISEAGAIN